jgi:hypothetical protein
LWTLDAALKYFQDQQITKLKVIGVGNQIQTATLQGKIIITMQDKELNSDSIDLGKGYGMQRYNLLSASLLNKVGAVLHSEKSIYYSQPSAGSFKIPFMEKDGLFHLPVDQLRSLSKSDTTDQNNTTSYSFHGRNFSVSANLDTWHRRARHINKQKLCDIAACAAYALTSSSLFKVLSWRFDLKSAPSFDTGIFPSGHRSRKIYFFRASESF